MQTSFPLLLSKARGLSKNTTATTAIQSWALEAIMPLTSPRSVQRVGEEGIRYRIKSPEKALEKSWRKMPNLKVSEAEINNLVAFFQWVGEINNGDWPPQDSKQQLTRGEEIMVAKVGVSAGAAVYKSKGCMNCHSLHGEGGTFGPPHDHIGSKLTAEQIEHYVKDPKSVNPKAHDAAPDGTFGKRA